MADSCYWNNREVWLIIDNEISNSLLERLFMKKAKIAITSGGNELLLNIADSDTSLFAKAFTDALTDNSDQFISASSIFTHIRDKVIKNSNQTPQYFNIRELDDDGGEFAFQKLIRCLPFLLIFLFLFSYQHQRGYLVFLF